MAGKLRPTDRVVSNLEKIVGGVERLATMSGGSDLGATRGGGPAGSGMRGSGGGDGGGNRGSRERLGPGDASLPMLRNLLQGVQQLQAGQLQLLNGGGGTGSGTQFGTRGRAGL